MWERMFDLVLGLKKEHRLMMVITLIYAVTLFGITVDVEAMENWLQLVGYTIRTLCIACIIQLSVFFLLKNRHKAQRKAKFYINKCRSASCMQSGWKRTSA